MRELPEVCNARAEGAAVDCADDDEGGVAGCGRIGHARDGRVRAEVDDAPPTRAQREAEGEKTEVVLLGRGAGEQGGPPDASAPAAGEPE